MNAYDNALPVYLYAQSRTTSSSDGGPGNINLAYWLMQASDAELAGLINEHDNDSGAFFGPITDQAIAFLARRYDEIPPFIESCKRSDSIMCMSNAYTAEIRRWMLHHRSRAVARDAVDTLLGGTSS